MDDQTKQFNAPQQPSAADAAEQTAADNVSRTPQDQPNAPAPDEEPAETSQTVSEEDKLAEMQANLDALNDRYLRLMAEFDNYRKRTIREKAELIQSASGEVLKDLLPVVDDYERGLKAMESTDDVAALKEGMALVYNKMRDFMQRSGVQEMEAVGVPFDTDRHEALTKIPAPDAKLKGCVVDVITKGYMLHDRVLRFAKVVVGE